MKKTILDLDLDVDKLIKKATEVKERIDDLNKQQKELKKEGKTSSKVFIENSANLKFLNRVYRESISMVSDMTLTVSEQEAREEALGLVLKKNAETVEEARKQNKILNQLRNSSNTTTKEGVEELAKLNEKLDENNEYIKENVDGHTRLKMNIGNYKDDIKEAYSELDIFNGGLEGFISRSEEVGGVGKLVKGSLGGMAKGFWGMTKSSLAFIATPIGALLAVLVGAFALVKNAMNRSEKSTKKITAIFGTFSAITNKVLKTLEPLGEFLIDGIVVGFESVGKIADKTMSLLSSGLSLLGFEKASKGVDTFKNSIKESAKEAQELANAEAKLEKEQRKARLTQLEYQKDAEKLRQIRDDETLSTKARIKANEDLGATLKQQLKEELRIAKLSLKVVDLKIKSEGKKKELLDAQADALTEIADIEERITGQQSEQLTNRVSLQKEANDKARELARKKTDDALKEQKTQLDLFIANQGIKAKTLAEEVKLAEQVSKKKIDILKAELKAKKITQSEFDLGVINEKNELAKKRAELTVDNAKKELEELKNISQSKLSSSNALNDEVFKQELKRIEDLKKAEKEYQDTRLQNGVINQTEYKEAIKQIDDDYLEKKRESEAVRQEEKEHKETVAKEKKITDLENERALNEENFQAQLELELSQLEAKRVQEVAEAEKTGADIALINKKYAFYKRKIEDEGVRHKLEMANKVLGSISELLGKESDAGKAVALAQATINVAQGVTKAIAQGGFAGIATGVSVASAGAVSIKKILATKKPDVPKAEHGMALTIGGNRHSGGGTKFYGEDGTFFEAEQGEKLIVLNRGASQNLEPVLSDINQMYGGVKLSSTASYLRDGGTVKRGNIKAPEINYDLLAEKIGASVGEANRELPNPQVSLADINNQNSNIVSVSGGFDE